MPKVGLLQAPLLSLEKAQERLGRAVAGQSAAEPVAVGHEQSALHLLAQPLNARLDRLLQVGIARLVVLFELLLGLGDTRLIHRLQPADVPELRRHRRLRHRLRRA